MLKYLLSFGIETSVDPEDIKLNYEIDIDDITLLQGQINKARKAHYQLLELNDNLQEQYLSKKSELSKMTRQFHQMYPNRTERLDMIAQDIVYSDLNDSIDAIKEAMKIVGSQIDYVKSDLTILKNSMYRKL